MGADLITEVLDPVEWDFPDKGSIADDVRAILLSSDWLEVTSVSFDEVFFEAGSIATVSLVEVSLVEVSFTATSFETLSFATVCLIPVFSPCSGRF